MSRIVEFDRVGLRYGTGGEVLSDVSFALARGGLYTLTGASGAGKTSLLQLLYLARLPTRGAITVLGVRPAAAGRDELALLRRRIGVVFQDFRLVPHLSARENVALPLRLAGVAEPEIDTRVDELLAWVGLGERAHGRPATLSGGEQQRVAIARAVIGRPELLLADEPTGNVDPDMAARLLQLFEALNTLGTTIVIATHDVNLIARLPAAQLMRLQRNRLIDPTGALRFPPQRAAVQ